MFDSKFGSHSFDNSETNLYEVLDIKPEASPAEIRESYIRIKNTYSKDSVALYTLIDPSEREDILKRIEQAYVILSNPVARREYDQSFGTAPSSTSSDWFETDTKAAPPNVVSIDRVPPMENVENAERALISPVTDFGFPTTPDTAEKTVKPPLSPFESEPMSVPTSLLVAQMDTPVVVDIEIEIQAETEWSGAFLRKVRESRGIAIEEIIQASRITRAYVLAIEEENAAKLPAPVYVRGFVNQIARILRITNQDVAAAYMRRYQRLHPEKLR
jgi:flagellar biosynthesis protein FlhG